MGVDGVNQIDFMLLEGSAGRMWISVKHFTDNYSPMGKVELFVPETPYDPFILLDACLLFAPQLFISCPTLDIAQKQIGRVKRVDFNAKTELITSEWQALRSEARDTFNKLAIWKGELKEMKL